MTKRKLERFAELNTFENVIQPKQEDFIDADFKFKNKWAKEFFNNKNPVILELGCGKGEYTIGLAEKYLNKNFIGVDIKGDRLWRGGKTSIEKKIKNVAFIRIQIEQILDFFGKDEISEIWITFPDPQPNKRRIKKRLTSSQFLERYKKILIPNGCINLKTDNIGLFNYTLEVIREAKHNLLYETNDLYNSGCTDDILSIKTYYEDKFTKKGFKICYLKFQIN